MLIIAHRLRTIVDTDSIIIMDKGRCSEMGSPYELAFDESTLFRRLINFSGAE